MKKRKISILLLMALFCWPFNFAYAGQMENEIDHLLNYIRNSGCVFFRNGDEHNSAEAVDHILGKYDYFKEDIRRTEDFIELCATKSTISKEFYFIKCGNREQIKVRDWLMAELLRYRSR